MRQRFEQQMQIGGIAIKDVHINLKSRDELPPVMKALQYIFVTPDLNEKNILPFGGQDMCREKEDRSSGDGLMAYIGACSSSPCHEH